MKIKMFYVVIFDDYKFSNNNGRYYIKDDNLIY